MARLLYFSIHDDKAKVFRPPFQAENLTEAVRSVTSAVNNAQKPTFLSEYPDDFSLYSVGEFDEATGQFVADQGQNYPFRVTPVSLLVRKQVLNNA